MAFASLDGDRYTEEELKTFLGRQVARRPWPAVNTVVSIAEDWDGASTYGSKEFLALKAGDRVKVTERTPLGAWLYGTVLSRLQGAPGASGWFGGPGCEAVMSIALHVPLGMDVEEALPTKDEGELFEDAPGERSLEQEVEDYVQRNNVDGSAAETLRALSPELQAEIIKNDMTNCRSPSAVLLSRIERLRREQPVAPSVAPRPVLPRVAPTASRPRQRSRTPLRAIIPAAKRFEAPPMVDVEAFIQRHRLDDSCGQQLWGLNDEEKQIIMNSDLTNARNPSAVVLSRIARVRQAAEAVEEYISRNRVDTVAAAALRLLPFEQQQQVMLSDLSSARNPSAVLLSRIRHMEASLGVPRGQPPPPTSHAWHVAHVSPAEDFVRTWQLDEKVAQELRALSQPDLMEVMSCNVANARNPSAMVRSRIQKLRARPQLQHMVEGYLARYEVDEVAQATLRSAAPEVQARVVEEEMVNCRNPSAVLISRIRAISSGTR